MSRNGVLGGRAVGRSVKSLALITAKDRRCCSAKTARSGVGGGEVR